MAETTTKKLTKVHFDQAISGLYGALNRPVGHRINFSELERGGKRDFYVMQQRFETDELKIFGLPVVLFGTVFLNLDRSVITLRAQVRFKSERRSTVLPDAELVGDYDGRWNLRWW